MRETLMLRQQGVSIIVLAYGQLTFLRKLISSLNETNYQNFEVIIVNNRRFGKDLEEIAKLSKHPTRVISPGRNLGFCAGNNLAFRYGATENKYVAFLNDDVILTPDWLSQCVEVLARNEGVGVVQPLITDYEGRMVQSGGFFPVTLFGRVYVGLFYLRGVGEPVDSFVKGSPVPYRCLAPLGSAFVVRRSVFDLVDGFDEYFVMGDEDFDFGWRVNRKGFPVFVVPAAIVMHFGRGSHSSVNKELDRLAIRNRILTMRKNMTASEFAIGLPLAITFLLSYAIFICAKSRTRFYLDVTVEGVGLALRDVFIGGISSRKSFLNNYQLFKRNPLSLKTVVRRLVGKRGW